MVQKDRIRRMLKHVGGMRRRAHNMTPGSPERLALVRESALLWMKAMEMKIFIPSKKGA